MISKEQLEANFKKFCEENGLINEWVTFEEYYIDNFFNQNEHVWDEIAYLDGNRNPDWEENQENLEIDIDGWFHNDYPKCPDNFPIDDNVIQTLFDTGCISDNTENQWYNIEDFGFKFYKDLPEEMKENVDEWWDSIDDEYIEEYNEWLFNLLNIDTESYSKSTFIEEMSYWTIYFEPDKIDWSAAWKSGLYPFKYYGKFMLALGGCGMDLSPKLDCYQALTDGSLPNNSEIFKDVKYFDYVSTVKHEEIFNKCKRNNVKVIFNAEIKEE